MVERNTPGFTIGARHNTMGIRSAMVSELHFTDVRVPVANMITPPGKGFVAAMKTRTAAASHRLPGPWALQRALLRSPGST